MSREITQSAARDQKIGLYLVKERLVTEAQLGTAMDFQRTVGGSVGGVLLRLDFIESEVLENFYKTYPELFSEDEGKAELVPEADDGVDILVKAAAVAEAAAETAAEAAAVVVSPVIERPEPEKPSVGVGASAEGSESHTGLILDALLRVLIRKGILEGEEIKEEILRVEVE